MSDKFMMQRGTLWAFRPTAGHFISYHVCVLSCHVVSAMSDSVTSYQVVLI